MRQEGEGLLQKKKEVKCVGETAIVPAVRERGHNNDNGQTPGLALQLRCGQSFNIPTG